MIAFLIQAGQIALPDDRSLDPRAFWFGCVGVRTDGAVVVSKNGSIQNCFSKSMNPDEMQKISDHHAEGRVIKKMTRGGVIYVSRISRLTKELILARPCSRCRARIRSHKIDKVYYSINKDQYGVWSPKSDPDGEKDKIFE